jgi:putative addiction module antidote
MHGVGMIQQKIWKVGNSYVVTIPKSEMERLGLTEGQTIAFEPQPMELRPVMTARLREIYEQIWTEHAEGYRYLADR